MYKFDMIEGEGGGGFTVVIKRHKEEGGEKLHISAWCNIWMFPGLYQTKLVTVWYTMFHGFVNFFQLMTNRSFKMLEQVFAFGNTEVSGACRISMLALGCVHNAAGRVTCSSSESSAEQISLLGGVHNDAGCNNNYWVMTSYFCIWKMSSESENKFTV